ncbi:MAG: DUF732 domain-containing protein [Mycobacterium sp.]
MNELSTRSRRVVAALVAGSAAVLGLPTAELPSAKADTLAYLVNVTVRPGYNFANADQALAYGYGVCDKFATGRTYAQVMGDIKADFNTANEYQASYLIAQTAQELCPAQIWQIRTSAAGYAAPPD